VERLATTVRRARPADKEQLMEFIREIWGGHDYLPKVWDAWIRERGAKMFVAEVGGRPVAMNRVNFLEDGIAWLEGARVHPDYRGRGLATLLGKNSLRIASRMGIGTLRLASDVRNKSARRQVARMGFREISRMTVYAPRKSARFRRLAGVRKAGREDISRVAGAVQSSKEFKRGRGVYWEGFRAISLKPGILRRRVLEGSVYIVGSAIAMSKRVSEGAEAYQQIGFACGDTKDMSRLISHLFSRTTAKVAPERILCAPNGSNLAIAARKSGLARWFSLILFERRLAKG
jgi:GNAT superfamily N-acetyltransferase